MAPTDTILPQLKDYLNRNHLHYTQLNQTSTDKAVIAYAGHKADMLFEVLSTVKELEGGNEEAHE